MNSIRDNKNPCRSIIKTIVIVFALGYGLHYFAYFLRARYFDWLDSLTLDEGISHCLMYLGHLIFLIVFLLYAWAIRNDRQYIFSFCKGKPLRNLKYALVGAAIGFVMMGICVLGASLNGNLVIHHPNEVNVPLLVFGALCVFIQSSVEEIESRAFIFGKMSEEGVPVIPAILVSSFFFTYLHMAKPGFGILPLFSIFLTGILYALCYHYFNTIWIVFTAHMMWNFTQDFIFGLPNSGTPAAVSLFVTNTEGSGFFYDQTFGIEGSWMAIIVNLIACIIVFLIGRYTKQRKPSN